MYEQSRVMNTSLNKKLQLFCQCGINSDTKLC